MRHVIMAAVSVLVIITVLILYCLSLRKKIVRLKEAKPRDLEALEKRLKEEYSVRMVDKQAKLSVLQSQINPHFLYNTLECIRSEAYVYNCDSIAKMSKALASFFRYSISKKENIVTIQEELHNIENYFLIQSYRFDDKFSYEIKVNPEERDSLLNLIPKMSLQPIVENSIFHGLETKASDGKITIIVETTDRHISLNVSDNGVGIAREQLEKIKGSLKNAHIESMSSNEHGSSEEGDSKQGGGIALANVSQRLRLIFGEDYSLNIYSMKGIGTDVEIILPAMTDRSLL